jgi:hypothetical protein
VKFPFFFFVVSILFFGCAHQSILTRAAPDRWPFRINGELGELDIAQIVAVIRRTPGIGREIAWIDVRGSNSVEVYTGRLSGPLDGGGNVVTLRERQNKWIVIGDPGQSFWNA